MEPYTGVIDRILEEDHRGHKKQRHTAKRIFERLRDEYGFDGGYTIVKDYVREHRRRTKEMFVPLSHSPGHAQCDFCRTLLDGPRELGGLQVHPDLKNGTVYRQVRTTILDADFRSSGG